MEFNKEQIRHTVSAILHAQGESLAAEILDSARAEIRLAKSEYDADYYSLDLRIPAARFGILESELISIERTIQAKLWKLGVNDESTQLNTVNIYPEFVVGSGAISVPVPTRTDETRIWAPNRIRLFLSHVSRIKVHTSELKRALARYGIDAFVAHEDIQPTMEWSREIEFALRSMHMFCALVTEDFIKSQWTDQEVGFALGRGIPVVAVRCGADPYGLLGKHQALKGDITKLESAASQIADIAAQQEILRSQLMDGLVDAVCHAMTYQGAKEGMRFIGRLSTHLTDAQIIRLLEAARDNSQVGEATGVPAQINRIATSRRVTLPEKAANVVRDDDDIPF